MTIQRIYHTGFHCYITADVLDMGAKVVTVPATGDEALQPERLPRPPVAPRPRRDSPCTVALLAALRAAPGTHVDLSQRTGFAVATVLLILRADKRFAVVSRMKLVGRWRKVWGLAE